MKRVCEWFAGFIICGAAILAVCWPVIAIFIVAHFVFKYW